MIINRNRSVIDSLTLISSDIPEIMDLAKSATCMCRYTCTRSEGPDRIDPLVARKTIDIFANIISDIIYSFLEMGFPVSTGIGPQSLPECAFGARPGLWRICLCLTVARIAEHKYSIH